MARLSRARDINAVARSIGLTPCLFRDLDDARGCGRSNINENLPISVSDRSGPAVDNLFDRNRRGGRPAMNRILTVESSAAHRVFGEHAGWLSSTSDQRKTRRAGAAVEQTQSSNERRSIRRRVCLLGRTIHLGALLGSILSSVQRVVNRAISITSSAMTRSR